MCDMRACCACRQGAMDASNLLKPMLGRGELRCIGATTLDEYRKCAWSSCTPLSNNTRIPTNTNTSVQYPPADLACNHALLEHFCTQQLPLESVIVLSSCPSGKSSRFSDFFQQAESVCW